MNELTRQDGVTAINFALSNQYLFRGIEKVPEDQRKALITDIAMCIYACCPSDIFPTGEYCDLAEQMAKESC